MLWVVFALSGAVFEAAYYTLLKQWGNEADPHLLASGVFLTAAAMLLSVSSARGFPDLGPGFLPAALIAAMTNILAAALYFKALRQVDLSLTVPMLSFTPVFLVVTSYVILGETPSMVGLAGILFIVAGSYVLNATSHSLEEPLDPVRKMMHTGGIRAMLIVAFLFSISLSYDKVVLLNSDPYFGMGVVLLMAGSVFLAVSLAKGSKPAITFKQHPALFLAAGAALALSTVGTNMAFSLQIASYVIAIKRLSAFFTVIYGIFILGEGHLQARSLGAAMMVAGAVIVAF
ncbi:MAG TPA: DMT family transporter [Candidatus Methanoculleus thermohydrogenotrophicum]|jgi:drug/metabolite transporter (DMT)-like permease|nr:DMT family transporter [Candidatus Methanoculleus thermohydrogenotrophicum]NLM81326.1 EamA family transporter [Candidatus Methanoculleus thermohydrogenotrophicum]HOB18558.1 DMT family transporter [Candidatus Methanoculleus thermohydrogenotrophicum]HPZ38673.1 DMT family transporter [Candidatus Methanoculleus thermohydrogenotrophicum]HQC91039.1 DMT family transporter [Candidatus Methanoculleus thermohydrogenotrophicum]